MSRIMTERKTRNKKTKSKKTRKNKTKKVRGGKSKKSLGWEKKVENVITNKSKETHYSYLCKYFYKNEDDKRTYDTHLITTDDPEFEGDDKYLADAIAKENDKEKRKRLMKIQASKEKFVESIQKRIANILKEREEEAARKAGEEADLNALVEGKKAKKADEQELQENERLAVENKKKQEEAAGQTPTEVPLVENAIDCNVNPEKCENATQATDVINTSDIPIADIATKNTSILSKWNPFAKKNKKVPLANVVNPIPVGTTQDIFHGVDTNQRWNRIEEERRQLPLRIPKRL